MQSLASWRFCHTKWQPRLLYRLYWLSNSVRNLSVKKLDCANFKSAFHASLSHYQRLFAELIGQLLLLSDLAATSCCKLNNRKWIWMVNRCFQWHFLITNWLNSLTGSLLEKLHLKVNNLLPFKKPFNRPIVWSFHQTNFNTRSDLNLLAQWNF